MVVIHRRIGVHLDLLAEDVGKHLGFFKFEIKF